MKTKAEVVFADELAYIGSDEIRGFVIDVFNKFTPDYFWSVPCSTSGKYHPKVSIGPGGLVRHVKYAVWWGLEIMQCWPNLSETAIDEVIAALILHDLLKNGDKLDTRGFPTLKNSTGVHGPYLGGKIAAWIGGELGKPETAVRFQEPDRISRILAGIDGHMGIWTDPSYEMFKPQYMSTDQKTYDVATIVHLADYCSSRKADEEMQTLQYDPAQWVPMFAVGQEDDNCGIGFWSGPVESINLMLQEDGRDDRSVIVCLDPIDGDHCVYRWDTTDNYWKPTT